MPYPCFLHLARFVSCGLTLYLSQLLSLLSDLCGLPPNAFPLLTLSRNASKEGRLRFTFGDLGRCWSILLYRSASVGAKLRLEMSFSMSKNYSVGVLNQRSNLCLPDASEPEGSHPVGVRAVLQYVHCNSVELHGKDTFNFRSIANVLMT